MLKARVITAVVLLVLLLPILFSGSYQLIVAATAVFFAAAAWECLRLFNIGAPLFGAAVWTAVYLFLAIKGEIQQAMLLPAACVAIWVIRLTPSLAFGLPPLESFSNRLLSGVYGIALLGCFVAIITLLEHSPLYLLSVMAIVWVADVGAYFAGKAFGTRKLAPSISPGKSWEGAIGGWLACVILAVGAQFVPQLADTFVVRVATQWGWPALLLIVTLLVAFSIVGDLYESLLKRRAGMKDSSNLLPGHGGVLDRIDALIPVLPCAVLMDKWL